MFESRLHRHNAWIENFSKEIKLEDYSIVLESKHRELYLQIHQYKFTFVKHIQLFIFKLEILCLQIWHARWDLSTAHLVLLWKKKTPSPCYQLQWPLARTFKLHQLRVQLDSMLLSLTTILVQLPMASLKLLINFNFNRLKKPMSRLSSPWIFLQVIRFSTKSYPTWSTSSLGQTPFFLYKKLFTWFLICHRKAKRWASHYSHGLTFSWIILWSVNHDD